MKKNTRNMFQVRIAFDVAKRTVAGTACLLFGMMAGTVVSTTAFADGDPATQTVLGQNMIIPYDGYLMVDSTPVTGTKDMIFRLYDEADNELWNETITVQLFSGRFSVGLGSSNALNTTILDAEQLYLGMRVLDTDASGVTTEVALSGKQAIEPAPFAAWAANSSDFAVAGDLTVASDASVAGDLDVDGDLILGASNATALTENANGELYISGQQGHPGGVYVGNDFQTNYDTQLGSSTSISNTIVVGTESDGSTGAFAIQSAFGQEMVFDGSEIDTNSTLFLQNNSGNDIRLQADTQVAGEFEVTGGVTIGGDITVTGDITNLTVSDAALVSHANATGLNNQTGDLCEAYSGWNPAGDTCSNTSSGGGHWLGSEGNRICFLTGAGFQDLDGNDERGMCSVHVDSGNWYLVASATTSDADVFCNARCLTW